MRRIQKVVAVGVAILVTWTLGCIAVQDSTNTALKHGVLFAPIAGAGLYAVAVLGMLVWGVCMFRSVPEEAEALRRELREAHAFLRKHGVAI